jgi:hypothetical protein
MHRSNASTPSPPTSTLGRDGILRVGEGARGRPGRAVGTIGQARLIRGGGIAGLIVPVPMLAAAAITVVVGPNLRQYGFPWVSAVAAVLCGACTLAVTAAHAHRWRRLPRAATMTTAAGLLGVAGFFAAIGTEDLIATRVDGTRFLSDDGAIAAVGTLIASVLTLVVIPVGLGILGSAVVSARVLGRTGRLAAAALAPSLILAALVTAIADRPWMSAAMVAVFAASWHVLGRSLLRAQPHPVTPKELPHA